MRNRNNCKHNINFCLLNLFSFFLSLFFFHPLIPSLHFICDDGIKWRNCHDLTELRKEERFERGTHEERCSLWWWWRFGLLETAFGNKRERALDAASLAVSQDWMLRKWVSRMKVREREKGLEVIIKGPPPRDKTQAVMNGGKSCERNESKSHLSIFLGSQNFSCSSTTLKLKLDSVIPKLGFFPPAILPLSLSLFYLFVLPTMQGTSARRVPASLFQVQAPVQSQLS